MIPARIPVSILAENPAEKQAFEDVFTGGLAGMVTLWSDDADGERPLVTLVCPSANMANVPADQPCVVIGSGPLSAPASLSDIIAAIENAAMAGAISQAGPRHHAGWCLEAAKMSLYNPDSEVFALTDTEVRLLSVLFDAKDGDITRDTLLQRVWGYRPGLDTHTVETHIYRLRQKIETDPSNPVFVITTDHGYRLAQA